MSAEELEGESVRDEAFGVFVFMFLVPVIVYPSRPSDCIAAAHDPMNSATRVAFGATLAPIH